MWVRPLHQEDPLEEGMATHTRILRWRIPWTVESDWLQSITAQRVRHSSSNLAGMHIVVFNMNDIIHNTIYILLF